jgi:hypothetical protein
MQKSAATCCMQLARPQPAFVDSLTCRSVQVLRLQANCAFHMSYRKYSAPTEPVSDCSQCAVRCMPCISFKFGQGYMSTKEEKLHVGL